VDYNVVGVFCERVISCFLFGLLLGAAQVVTCDGCLLSDLADLIVQLNLGQLAAEELEPRTDGLNARFALQALQRENSDFLSARALRAVENL
jgi:hypothetical protein